MDKLVSVPYVRMTLALMERFGVRVEREGWERFRIPPGQSYLSPGSALVEGDASSASYFLAGAAITGSRGSRGSRVRVRGCGTDSLQGDARFAGMLERMGAAVRWEPAAIEVEGVPGRLRGIDADLEVSTVNGSIDTAFPITVTGRLSRRRLRGRIGDGGALISVRTVNGSIQLRRSR